jgi:hypothetical protein
MRIWIAFAALCLSVAGCTLLSSDKPSLQGFWGGESFEVTASPSSLVIDEGCYRVTFPGPTQLIRSDSFAITGTVTVSSWEPMVGQPWRAWGSISGDTLRLVTSYRILADSSQWLAPGGPQVLIAGRHSDSVANPTCVV